MAFTKTFAALFLALMTYAIASPVEDKHEVDIDALAEFTHVIRSVPTLPVPPGLINCLVGLITRGKCSLGGPPSSGGEKPCCGPSRRIVMPDGAVVRANAGVIKGTCKLC